MQQDTHQLQPDVPPDRLAAVARDEQRAVIAVNEECLTLQEQLTHVPVEAEPSGHRTARNLLALLLLAVVIAVAYLVWRYAL